MALRLTAAVLFLGAVVHAQQGVLTNGNSELPACGQTCPLLVQAVDACPGASTTSDSTTWGCFCQSAYLTQLRTSATGICDSTCTSTTDLQQLSKWYSTNCGSDNGVSEHAAGTAATSASTTAAAAAAASSTAAADAAATSSATTVNGGTSTSDDSSSSDSGDWWSNHFRWIIMVIVLAVCFPAIAMVGVWLKRRHDRKHDQITGGFNAGITDRVGPMGKPHLDQSGAVTPAGLDGSGKNTPARTREAFMPYGYGYSRSESRVGSKQAVNDDRRSPLSRGNTSRGEVEKGSRTDADHTPAKKKSRKVLVRERSEEDTIEKNSYM